MVKAEVRRLEVGQTLRDARPKATTPHKIGPHVNFYAATCSPSGTMVPFDKGINPIAEVNAVDGKRRPGFVIASSPHKSGSIVTPWQDLFAPDEGYVRYFGDQRQPGRRACDADGNRLLGRHFEEFHAKHTPSERLRAAPLLFFARAAYEGQPKGYPRFQGFGLITAVRVVAQFNEDAGTSFANLEFECAVLKMEHEGETFDWAWINHRRDPALSAAQTLQTAPKAWREWVNDGNEAIERVRRRVLRRRIVPLQEQLPAEGSKAKQLLYEIYKHYDGHKAHFESLAAAVAERVIAPDGKRYKNLGLTKGSGDFGIDFVAQLDVGDGISRTPLVVLGQAKCIKPDSAARAVDIARTVARLRRGWIGVFVTTGSFTPRCQQEVFLDRYPIVLIPGLRVAQEIEGMLHEKGHQDLAKLLMTYDDAFILAQRVVDPERLIA